MVHRVLGYSAACPHHELFVEAMLWTEKEVEVNVYCLGDDHPDYQKEASVMNQLRDAAKRKKPFHYTHINWILDWDQGPN